MQHPKKEGKILVVCQTIHPWTSGSSVIMSNLAAQFSRDEMVIFGEEYTGARKSTWQDSNPQIIYDNPNFHLGNKGHSFFRWKNINRTIKKLIGVAHEQGVKKIFAVYPDDYYIYAAYRVSKILGLPLYTWFHNTYLDNVKGYKKVLAHVLQPKVFKHAIINFTMSEGMTEFFEEKYPHVTFRTLVHAFELPSDANFGGRVSSEKKKKTFVYSGFLNESCREASIRLIKVIQSMPDTEIHAFTGTSLETFSQYGVDTASMVFHPFVPMEEFYKALNHYDVMLLPHGFDGGRTEVEYNTIFPTRTIPLLVCGKPILAHSPQGSFLSRFLADRDCALVIDTKDDVSIREGISQLLRDNILRTKLVRNATAASQIFRAESVAKKLRIHL